MKIEVHLIMIEIDSIQTPKTMINIMFNQDQMDHRRIHIMLVKENEIVIAMTIIRNIIVGYVQVRRGNQEIDFKFYYFFCSFQLQNFDGYNPYDRNQYDDRSHDRNPYDDRNRFNNDPNRFSDDPNHFNNNPNSYNNRNPYSNDGKTYDDRDRFNNDPNPYNNRNPYNNDPNSYNNRNPNSNPNYPNPNYPNPIYNNENYDDRNRYTNEDYEQYRLELERKNRIEDANLRRVLDDVDKLSSSECFNNVRAQWAFETNVNDVTQQESVNYLEIIYFVSIQINQFSI